MSKQLPALERDADRTALDLARCAPIAAQSLDGARAADVARVFKALSDPVRLRLLSLITSAQGEICVCDLTPHFEVSGPTISHHLKVLREAGLVDCRRRGTWVHYRPRSERLRWLSTVLAAPGLDPDARGADS